MNNLEYLIMYIGFAMWFWAGYNIGKRKNK